jgi:hypothetical protein
LPSIKPADRRVPPELTWTKIAADTLAALEARAGAPVHAGHA